MVHLIPAKPPLPPVAAVHTEPVQWHVLKKGLAAATDLFTLTPDQFQALTANETDFLRWISEAQKQFKYYQEPPKADAPAEHPR